MTKSERKRIDQALDDRKDWADRQQTWFAMRAGTIKRRSKPYRGAPDVRYPLGDTLIEKLKPAYLQQAYAEEHIFSFKSLRQQDEAATQGCEAWLDYNLKQRSNFERTLAIGIDQKCECAFTVIKTRWDVDNSRLSFTQIDPLHFIVPQTTQELNEEGGADWCVHVLHMSEAEYRANPQFIQDDDLIKKIKGKGSADDNSKLQEKDRKEGVNCSNDENEIVLWEYYNRDRKNKRIMVETISPLLGEDDCEVRTPMRLPYNKGCFKNGEHFPFFKLRYEIKGKGWYTSRGVMEINAPFENALSKNWNTILQWADFFANPLFQNTGAYSLPAANNFKTNPGSILPPGLVPVVPPSAPDFLREDMNLLRALAEDRTQVPDLNASEHLTGNVPATQTATGVQAVMAQSSQGADMKARTYRMDLAQGGKIAWSILIQYATAPNVAESLLEYVQDNQVTTIDIQNLTDAYEITPNGSADNWNKSTLVSKRLTYYQTFKDNPYIAMDEMTKWVLEAEDPRLVKRLYRDPGQTAATQSEDQAVECLLMTAGYPSQVQPANDDKAHLAVLDMFAKDKIQKVEMTPEIAGLLLQHGIGHMEQLKTKKDPMLKAVEAKLQPTAELLTHISRQPGPQPENVLPMQPNLQQPTSGADQSQVAQAAQPQTAASSQDRPSAVITALATAYKAGLPVTAADFSEACVKAGLPPLGAGPVIPPQPISQPTQPQPAQATQ